MKKTILGLFLGMSVMGMAATNTGDNEVSDNLEIKANLIATITIEQTKPMDFGDVPVGRESIAYASGTMLVTGSAGSNITVTVPESATIQGDRKNATIEIDLTQTHSGGTQTLNRNGHFAQTVSGHFDPKIVKYAGKYAGTVTVSARYN